MANDVKQFATEAGHWYKPDGTPHYEVPRADGKGMRDTTLRDARKLGLFFSTTGIIRLMDAPGLTRWKMRQLALAILTLPRIEGESEDAFLARAEKDAQEEGAAARDKGTAIHADVERHYRGQEALEYPAWADAATKAIEGLCGVRKWLPEHAYAHPSGYGCKVDLVAEDGSWLLDIKTKDGDKSDLFDEHFMQLAANRRAANIPGARCGILFIDRNAPSATLVEVSEADLQKGLEMFDCLLALHRAKNRYDPRGVSHAAS